MFLCVSSRKKRNVRQVSWLVLLQSVMDDSLFEISKQTVIRIFERFPSCSYKNMFYRHVNLNKSVGGDGERDQFKLSEQHQNIFCLIISVIFLDKLLKKFLLTVRND